MPLQTNIRAPTVTYVTAERGMDEAVLKRDIVCLLLAAIKSLGPLDEKRSATAG
jgi:hypothetical protein